MNSKALHIISFIFGLFFFVLSIYQAIFLNYPHFYTSFAFGSWLVLDFIDYKLTNYSILGYFHQHKHRMAFFMFLSLTTVFCFIVDYLWGVRVSGMWEWVNYKAIHFVRMYLIMNASFVLSMYELFRVIKTLIYRNFEIQDDSLFEFKFYYKSKSKFYIYAFLIGLIGLIVPGYSLVFNTQKFIEYAMLFPFLSILLITDSLTYLTGGEPILDEVLKVKRLDAIALISTSFIASIVTELLNLFGNEWSYIKMPFQNVMLSGIPVAVFIGWIPLVVGSISIVNMVKHVSYVLGRRRIG